MMQRRAEFSLRRDSHCVSLVPWRPTVKIVVTKHFERANLCRWGWSADDLHQVIGNAYRIEQVGMQKFDVHIQKSGYKKIITVSCAQSDELVCVTGSQEGGRI